MSVCFRLHVWVQVYRCDTWREAPDLNHKHPIGLREWGSGASHWTEENTAGIRDSLLRQTDTYPGIHTHPHRQRNTYTHSHTRKWLKFWRQTIWGLCINQSQAKYTPAKTALSLCTFSSCTPRKRANPDGEPRTKLHFHFSIYLVKNSSSAEMISWLIY